jgi:hypothetical protein
MRNDAFVRSLREAKSRDEIWKLIDESADG